MIRGGLQFRSSLVWGIGTVLGPVVGGGFELYTWRWAFYINRIFPVSFLSTKSELTENPFSPIRSHSCAGLLIYPSVLRPLPWPLLQRPPGKIRLLGFDPQHWCDRMLDHGHQLWRFAVRLEQRSHYRPVRCVRCSVYRVCSSTDLCGVHNRRSQSIPGPSGAEEEAGAFVYRRLVGGSGDLHYDLLHPHLLPIH